jgi:oxalate decarboxylase/phosphoglucose isomerase-like protein (cupin superfamily)
MSASAQPRTRFAYDEWMDAQGVPVYRGYFVPDMRSVELGRWEERGCDAAFIQLVGQEGVSEARITEIPPGGTLPPYRMAVDELVYVVSGGGATTLWDDGPGGERHTFEWTDRGMFLVPPNRWRQFSNLRGDQPVRLMSYDYLPLAMSVVPDPDFFLGNPYVPRTSGVQDLQSMFSQARLMPAGEGLRWINGRGKGVAYWYGNLFPDMSAWDDLDVNTGRGAGGRTVRIQFAGSDMSCHMSVFDAKTYKKAHRHGPGRVIVVPNGEGYSVMWPEGGERVVVPWQEAALFVPPDRWFHQHFNLGAGPARYLALHPPIQFAGYAEKLEDRARDQIEYPDEDPWIRERFESELDSRGLKTLMPDEAYADRGYSWK